MMASILRTNSGRTALRCISHNSFIPSGFSSVRYISCGRDPIPISTRNWWIRFVPEMTAFVIERFGKYVKTLTTPGIHFLIPFVDKIAYVHSLRQQIIRIPNHRVITKDNMTILIVAMIYVDIVDPKLASYHGVEDPNYALIKLAQTTMHSEIGKVIFDKTFTETEALNQKIVESINVAAKSWGLKCLQYEAVHLRKAFLTNIA